jgi:hypothetical protein
MFGKLLIAGNQRRHFGIQDMDLGGRICLPGEEFSVPQAQFLA